MNVQDRSAAPVAAQDGARASRIMFYSHDTFGLGHLRRSRALASALTASDEGTSAIILTGSPIAGRFTFPERVDHVRLPGVSKLHDGTYVSQTLGLDIDEQFPGVEIGYEPCQYAGIGSIVHCKAQPCENVVLECGGRRPIAAAVVKVFHEHAEIGIAAAKSIECEFESAHQCSKSIG